MPRYWLSFDLGLTENYEGLYRWLDNLEAKECGDSVATFTSDKTVEHIRKELRRILEESARVYLVYTSARPFRHLNYEGLDRVLVNFFPCNTLVVVDQVIGDCTAIGESSPRQTEYIV